MMENLGTTAAPSAIVVGSDTLKMRHITPRSQRPDTVLDEEGIETRIEQTETTRSSQVNTQRVAKQTAQRSAVADDDDTLARMPSGDVLNNLDGSCMPLSSAFAFRDNVIRVAADEAEVVLGIAFLNLGYGQSLKDAEIAFPEARVRGDRVACLLPDGLGRAPGSPEVAGEQRVEVHVREPLGSKLGLAPAARAQVAVQVALLATGHVPERLAMAKN